MARLLISQKVVQGLGQSIGLVLVVLAALACDSIIEVVPAAPPTLSPTAPIQTPPPTAVITDIPTRIVAQAINLDAPVVAMGWQAVQQGQDWVSEWDMPDNEAAWHRNSARPGEGSNVVISGHNASTGGHVFAELDELQLGDEIVLWKDNNEEITYYVVEKNIVRTILNSEEAQNYLQAVMGPTTKEQLTLITCWPRWSNTHRLVVRAEPN
jgi:sortase A